MSAALAIVPQQGKRVSGQHFLMSSAAKDLSIVTVARMSEEEARQAFRLIRWADTNGEPVCPRCECDRISTYITRPIWRCKACGHQFSVTSDTLFASRKLPIRDILVAIAIFANSHKGVSSLQLSRELQCQYKTAYVLAQKIRETLANTQSDVELSGELEADGAFFGGHIERFNVIDPRTGRQIARRRYGERRVVVVIRQRGGRSRTFIVNRESEAVPLIKRLVAAGSTVHVDGARAWYALRQAFEVLAVDHDKAFSVNGTHTNNAESFHSMMRRMHKGVHHRMAGRYLHLYAAEMAWRQDNNRASNLDQTKQILTMCLRREPSRAWAGYWKRNTKKATPTPALRVVGSEAA